MKFTNHKNKISCWFGIFDDVVIDNSLSQGFTFSKSAVDYCCRGQYNKIFDGYIFCWKKDEDTHHLLKIYVEPKEKKENNLV